MNHTAPVVVVGAGIAGLVTALELAPQPVVVVARKPLGSGTATGWAQGGIAAAIDPSDSAEEHVRDTLSAAGGIANESIVARIVGSAPKAVEALLAYGVRFDRTPAGDLEFAREGGHRHARILHARDATGAEILRALCEAVRRTPSIQTRLGVATDLLLSSGEIGGVVISGTAINATAVVLATGGIGGLYERTTNPLEACGSGIDLAARAGALLADLEFVQFHPTALDVGLDPMPLISEALRGAGARIVDEKGRRFLYNTIPEGELAPRDRVARAVFNHLNEGHAVFLDTRAAIGDAIATRFPNAFGACMREGIDPRTSPIPVAPAAHYHMGGIAVDENGRTSIGRLWACGEVAATGFHGANRLASNSLLEGAVMAGAVAADLRPFMDRAPARAERTEPYEAWSGSATDVGEKLRRLRQTAYRDVGVVRSAQSLDRAIAVCNDVIAAVPRSHDLAVRARVLRLIARSASYREESRGSHYRGDFPNTDIQGRRAFVHAVR